MCGKVGVCVWLELGMVVKSCYELSGYGFVDGVEGEEKWGLYWDKFLIGIYCIVFFNVCYVERFINVILELS